MIEKRQTGIDLRTAAAVEIQRDSHISLFCFSTNLGNTRGAFLLNILSFCHRFRQSQRFQAQISRNAVSSLLFSSGVPTLARKYSFSIGYALTSRTRMSRRNSSLKTCFGSIRDLTTMKFAREAIGDSPAIRLNSPNNRSRSEMIFVTRGRKSLSYISTATSAAVWENVFRL